MAWPPAVLAPQQPSSDVPTAIFDERFKGGKLIGLWASSEVIPRGQPSESTGSRARWQVARGKLVPFPAQLSSKEGFTGALCTPPAAPLPQRSSCCSQSTHLSCPHRCVLPPGSFKCDVFSKFYWHFKGFH